MTSMSSSGGAVSACIAFSIEPARAIKRQHIVAGRDRRTPAVAKSFLTAMKGLFAWAFDAGHVKVNPVFDVKSPARRKSNFPPWTEEDVAR